MSPIKPENRARYGPDWKQRSMEIRIRARNRCECDGRCGSVHDGGRCWNFNGMNSLRTGGRVVLAVAHLNHIIEDMRDENLMAMCQACHLGYDRPRNQAEAAKTRAARKALIRLTAEDIGLLADTMRVKTCDWRTIRRFETKDGRIYETRRWHRASCGLDQVRFEPKLEGTFCRCGRIVHILPIAGEGTWRAEAEQA